MIMVLVELTLKAEGFDQRDVILSVLLIRQHMKVVQGLMPTQTKKNRNLSLLKNGRTGDPMTNTQLGGWKRVGDTSKTSG